ncbi:hypothetical protein CLOSTASPAR_01855 [[Clostridium] asparagiforme DSM 15981]|uniref:Uncharacterized protein n=1 Tax=[Clostridium] asparagiforme DSM 15981 TaxID=518636 RepID=C0CXY0_9FIRM|nr:hypothetical protein CLOSTASPAR_01855 [[Clostridium] asparagiforme DSM 15981]
MGGRSCLRGLMKGGAGSAACLHGWAAETALRRLNRKIRYWRL